MKLKTPETHSGPLAISHWFIVILFVSLILIGGYLRSYKLSSLRYIELDEVSWVINGVSLLSAGVPQSWTIFWDTYTSNRFHSLNLNGKTYTTVKPFLDHPPLFALFMGGWARVTGNDTAAPFNWAVLRLPMVGISILTIMATFCLGCQLLGKEGGVLTLFSFVFFPSHILSSRLITTENILALLLVLSLSLWFVYLKTKRHALKKALLVSLVIICLVSPLIKLSGSIIPLILISMALSSRLIKETFTFLSAFIASGFLLLLYGWHYDLGLFMNLLKANGDRSQTAWYLFTLFSKPDLGRFSLPDPMPILGIIGSMSMLVQSKESSYKQYIQITWFFLVLILIVIAPIELYGWYKFLVFPFLAIGLGYMWQQFWQGKISWSLVILPAVLVLLENTFQILKTGGFGRRLFIAGLFLPVLIFMLNPKVIGKGGYKLWVLVLFGTINILAGFWAYQLLLTAA